MFNYYYRINKLYILYIYLYIYIYNISITYIYIIPSLVSKVNFSALRKVSVVSHTFSTKWRFYKIRDY